MRARTCTPEWPLDDFIAEADSGTTVNHVERVIARLLHPLFAARQLGKLN